MIRVGLLIAAAIALGALAACDETIAERLGRIEGKGAAPGQTGKPADDAGQPKRSAAGRISPGDPRAAARPSERRAGESPPDASAPQIRLPDGYLKARFGMSPDEISGVYPPAFSRAEAGTLMLVHHLKRIPPEDLRFHFYEGRLHAIEHIRKTDAAQEASRLTSERIADLQKELGPPRPGGVWTDGTRLLKIERRDADVATSIRLIAETQKAQRVLLEHGAAR